MYSRRPVAMLDSGLRLLAPDLISELLLQSVSPESGFRGYLLALVARGSTGQETSASVPMPLAVNTIITLNNFDISLCASVSHDVRFQISERAAERDILDFPSVTSDPTSEITFSQGDSFSHGKQHNKAGMAKVQQINFHESVRCIGSPLTLNTISRSEIGKVSSRIQTAAYRHPYQTLSATYGNAPLGFERLAEFTISQSPPHARIISVLSHLSVLSTMFSVVADPSWTHSFKLHVLSPHFLAARAFPARHSLQVKSGVHPPCQ
eukprot:766373-Hanusia_phi.AAC.7